jgi:hypothetical protein
VTVEAPFAFAFHVVLVGDEQACRDAASARGLELDDVETVGKTTLAIATSQVGVLQDWFADAAALVEEGAPRPLPAGSLLWFGFTETERHGPTPPTRFRRPRCA